MGHKRRDESTDRDRFDAEGIEFFERVRQGYLYLANAEPDRFVVLDATQPANVIAEQVYSEIKSLL